MKRVGIDIGGTFTDIVVFDEVSQQMDRLKVPTTSEGIEEGFLQAFRKAGLSPEDISYLVHGTTLVTNVIIERAGAKVGLITTRGFRDVLEIMRASRRAPYDLHWIQPTPLVPRPMRLEVSERVDARGEVVVPLSDDEVRQAILHLLDAGAEAIAVCFLHSYANPVHEERAKAIASEIDPDLSVSISSDVCRIIREYERTSTTVVNCYAMPSIRRYTLVLDSALPNIGTGIHYMNSEGGLSPPEEVRRLPMRLCLSGPAGGVLASQQISHAAGLDNLITLDMGGTSLDVCAVRAGAAQLVNLMEIAWGIPVYTPALDVKTIGAGGGSIVRIDDGGALQVGPGSAGARPGPACYGHGGTDCTVTDADVILGILDQEELSGGLRIHRDRALEAIGPIADHFKLSAVEAAEGVYRVVNANIAAAIRQITVDQGIDPRDFTLVSFGGAAGQHAIPVACEMGIPSVIIPPVPSVFSAFGMMNADVRYSRAQTVMANLDDAALEKSREIFAEIEREPIAFVRKQPSLLGVEVHRTFDIRYAKQAHEISVDFRPEDAAADLYRRFEKRHQDLYGTALGHRATVVTLRSTIVGLTPNVELKRNSLQPESKPSVARRITIYPNAVSVPVFKRVDLVAGVVLPAPALVEEVDTVHYIPPGCQTVVDEWLNIRIDTRQAQRMSG